TDSTLPQHYIHHVTILLSSHIIAFSFLCYFIFFFLMIPPPPTSTLFPYTTLFRSNYETVIKGIAGDRRLDPEDQDELIEQYRYRSEEHTSELQSRFDLVCRLLLEKKKTRAQYGVGCFQITNTYEPPNLNCITSTVY